MIRFLRKSANPGPAIIEEGCVHLDIAGDRVPVRVRRSARASRYGLRIANGTGEVVLTVPAGGDYDRAIDFLSRQEKWLAGRLRRRADFVPFEDGAEFPLRGEAHRIAATGRVRGAVRCVEHEDGPVLEVPGLPEHLGRRLTDWLKEEARSDLARCAHAHAAKIGMKPGRITVRDTTSRWGSCSASGGLSFSWRLVLAPPFVLDYVAAHEVAHLEHMNHSSRFWALTKRLYPDTDRAEAWLKRHGRGLHRYGRASG
ncbi:MAG: M48 family metallopeptidase [Rhodobiaceae bacterium]|nr:M48 family metallopeptidase [Rhodobiaceae bacterium]MCC0012681.1 M48 family metallopeptidase [Rhodobiaceae bacterium]MCC0018012.1 M48 family metallopeptidase [Rhodobiaceae bacterium]MCC0062036.1 M48 family metallopeptidase [Rhodobiaceae bacterium]